jgi:hypothetical protein
VTRVPGQDTVRGAGGVGPTAAGSFRCETFLMGRSCFFFHIFYIFESWKTDWVCFNGLSHPGR